MYTAYVQHSLENYTQKKHIQTQKFILNMLI